MASSQQMTENRKVVGARFSQAEEAQKAVDELVQEGFSMDNITLLQLFKPKVDSNTRREYLTKTGYNEADVVYLNLEVEKGKTLVSVSGISDADSASVIQILNKNGSQYNPDGSRNVRDDVVGMTTGAAIGAAIGAVVGGPIGAAVGVVAGGAAGGAVGTKMEESE